MTTTTLNLTEDQTIMLEFLLNSYSMTKIKPEATGKLRMEITKLLLTLKVATGEIPLEDAKQTLRWLENTGFGN